MTIAVSGDLREHPTCYRSIKVMYGSVSSPKIATSERLEATIISALLSCLGFLGIAIRSKLKTINLLPKKVACIQN